MDMVLLSAMPWSPFSLWHSQPAPGVMGLFCTPPCWNAQWWCCRQHEPHGTVLEKGRWPWIALSKLLAGLLSPEGYDHRFMLPNLAQ